MKLKREPLIENSRSAEKYDKLLSVSPEPFNDLRGTIKK